MTFTSPPTRRTRRPPGRRRGLGPHPRRPGRRLRPGHSRAGPSGAAPRHRAVHRHRRPLHRRPRGAHRASARRRRRREARAQGARISVRYDAALKGFAAQMSDRAVEALRNNPAVAYIEADQQVTLSATQSGATWGLDRIDQRSLPLSDATPTTRPGPGVTAYVIDTGILGTHADFGGRVVARATPRSATAAAPPTATATAPTWRAPSAARRTASPSRSRSAPGPRPRLQRLRLQLRRDRGRRLGDAATTPPAPRRSRT